MRFVLAALALAALVSPCAAQTLADEAHITQQMEVLKSLMSSDAEPRRAAVAQVVSRPGDHQPLVFSQVASALARDGMDAEALRWLYFAEIRARADIRLLFSPALHDAHAPPSIYSALAPPEWSNGIGGPVRTPVDPERRLAIFEEAARLEARTPRLYPPLSYAVWLDGDEEQPAGAWPAQPVIDAARRAAAAETRARVEREIARDREHAATAAAIDAGRIPDVARALVPAAWRNRIRPLGSQRIPEDCRFPYRAESTPPGAGDAYFVLRCHKRWLWFAAQDGRLAGDTRVPAGQSLSNRWWEGPHIAVRAGLPFITVQRERWPRDLVLLGRTGQTQVLSLPIAESGFARRVELLTMSPSGRYAILGDSARASAIFDIETGSFAWSAEGGSEEMQTLAFVDESDGASAVFVRAPRCDRARQRDCGSATVVKRSLATGAERSVALPPHTAYAAARPYGAGAALIELSPPPPASDVAGEEARSATQDAATIDLRTLSATWTGDRDAAPPPQGVAYCGVSLSEPPIVPDDDDRSDHLEAVLDGASFRLPAGIEGAACAASRDGARLLIVAPPFLHLYEVSGAR